MSLNLGQSKRSHSQPTPELSSLAGGAVEVNAAMPGAFLLQKDPWQTLGDAVPATAVSGQRLLLVCVPQGHLRAWDLFRCLTQMEKTAWSR